MTPILDADYYSAPNSIGPFLSQFHFRQARPTRKELTQCWSKQSDAVSAERNGFGRKSGIQSDENGGLRLIGAAVPAKFELICDRLPARFEGLSGE